MIRVFELKHGQVFLWPNGCRVPPCSPAMEAGTLVKFDHMDGMYSYCRVLEGPFKDEIVHPAAMQFVERI